MAGLSPRLIRLPVKEGKEDTVISWLNELSQNAEQNLESMQTEEIESESVFTSTSEGRLYITWVIVKATTSELKISDTPFDRKHHRVMMECIDLENPLEEAKLEYSLSLTGLPPESIDSYQITSFN